MPKFNGQNKKRNNPRYFLNETAEREEIEEGEKERTWDDAYAMGLPEPEFRAPWNSTKDMIDKLGEQAREASKAIYGYKVDVGNMTLDQIQDLLYDMNNSDVQRSMDDEAQREDDEAIGMQDDELDNSPKRMGMGRMEEEKKKEKLKEMIIKELANLLKENSSFTYNVIEHPLDGGPTVEIEGVDKSFESMMQDLEGKMLDFDDGDGPFEFSVNLFGGTEEMIKSGVAPGYVEMWAKLNGYQATRSGGYY